MPDDDNTLREAGELLSQGISIANKIGQAIDLFKGTPISVGDRSVIDRCIRERTVGGDFGPRETCKVRTNKKSFSFGVEFRRVGIKTDECDGAVTLTWSYDGCNLYDVFATETHQPNDSDWVVRLKPRIYPLTVKKTGECPCCPEGGHCLLVHLEWEVEREVALWPNPVLQFRESGVICAANGEFTAIP